MQTRVTYFTSLLILAFQGTAVSQSTPTIQFIENKNQWPQGIEYGARVSGGSMFVRPGGFSYYFLDQQKLHDLHERSHRPVGESSLQAGDEVIEGSMIQVNFLGSNLDAKATPFRKLPAYYNYFIGSDPRGWVSKASAYEGVYYSSFYPGIDLKVYSSGDFVKYDFVVSACADPSQIQMEYGGMEKLFVFDGDLHVEASHVGILEKRPVAFQVIDGRRVSVACEYILADEVLTFSFPHGYDSLNELVIDPLLIFSTYSGSQADNWGSTATPGENGNLYSAGVTNHFVNATFSGVFPATPGAFQTTYGGVFDVAILKYDSAGHQLLYASYLGGVNSESAHSLVVNNTQELIVLGTTSSPNFPTTAGAIDQTFNGGTAENNVVFYTNGSDIFVAKVSADGSQLLGSTFIGGSANDGLNPSSSILTVNYGDQLRGDVILDSLGNIFISSVTSSSNFPVSNSFGLTYKGGTTDALILKLNPTLSQITWGAFLGGASADASHTIKFDNSNNVFVAGGTASTDFAMSAGAYQSVHAGSADGWIARIANDGSAILSSTLTGTGAFDQVYFLDLNANDEVYVYGQTAGNFPVTSGVFHNPNSGQFVQKFGNDLTTLLFSTVFGSGSGTPDISPTAFLVNDCNNLYMSGWGGYINSTFGNWPGSSTLGMPTTPDAYQQTTSGSDFYFIVLTDDASEFLYGTYLGGNQSRTHVDGGTSRFDKSGVVYHSVCSGCVSGNAAFGPTSDFPTTAGAWSRTNNSINCNNAAFKFDLSSLDARIQTNSLDLKLPGFNRVCLPDKIVFQNRSTGGTFYEWTLGDGTSIVKTDTAAIVHQYVAPGQYTIKLKAVDAGTCIGKDSTYTVVNVFNPQGAVGEDLKVCMGASTQIIATGGGSYEWSDNAGVFSTLAAPVVSPVDTTRYFVTVTDMNGCVKHDSLEVNVVPGIDLKFEVSRIYDCISRPSVNVINLTDPKEEVFIDFGDGTTSGLQQDTHAYQADGNYVIRIVGKKEFCFYDESVVLPFFSLLIPNVITPAGSAGFNDYFKIKYGDRYISELEIKVSLVVYNRWGAKVYENHNYNDNWSAEGLPPGVYYYEAKIEEETACKDWVQVIK